MNNGEQIEKMDADKGRSSRKLEGQLQQAGKDTSGVEITTALNYGYCFGNYFRTSSSLNKYPRQNVFCNIRFDFFFVTVFWLGKQ